MRPLAKPGLQQIVVFNPSDVEYDGLITHGPLSADNPLLDEQDNPIPFQSVDHRSLLTTGSLFPLKVPADGYRVLHVGRRGTRMFPSSCRPSRRAERPPAASRRPTTSSPTAW